MVTWDNYEEYLMMHTDGELTPDKEQELLAFTHTHPEVGKEMKAYERTKITPDAELVFANKNSLLKPELQKRTIILPRWVRIAASIVLLISIATLENIINLKNIINTKPIKKISHVDSSNTKSSSGSIPQLVISNSKNNQNGLVPFQDSIVKNHNSNINIQKYAPVLTGLSPKRISSNTIPIDVDRKDPTLTREGIDALPIAGTKQMSVNTIAIPAPQILDIPKYTSEPNHPTGFKKFWDKLPLDKRNKKQIENVAGFVVGACQDIGNAKQNLEDKSLSLKISNYQLVISVN